MLVSLWPMGQMLDTAPLDRTINKFLLETSGLTIKFYPQSLSKYIEYKSTSRGLIENPLDKVELVSPSGLGLCP